MRFFSFPAKFIEWCETSYIVIFGCGFLDPWSEATFYSPALHPYSHTVLQSSPTSLQSYSPTVQPYIPTSIQPYSPALHPYSHTALQSSPTSLHPYIHTVQPYTLHSSRTPYIPAIHPTFQPYTLQSIPTPPYSPTALHPPRDY